MQPHRAIDWRRAVPWIAIIAAMLAVGLEVVAIGLAAHSVATGVQLWRLGAPWLTLGGVHIYPPWAPIAWVVGAIGSVPAHIPGISGLRVPAWAPGASPAYLIILDRAASMTSVLLAAAIMAVAVVLIVCRAVPSDLHGRAHWATPSDIRVSSLVGQTQGVVLGSSGRSNLIYDGTANVLVLGPPGAGKTYSTAVATLQHTWRRSAIVLDPATDIHAAVSANPPPGIRIVRFDARSADSARINPLAGIAAGDIAEIRTILAPMVLPATQHDDAAERYFDESALELIVAFAALAIERGNATLGGVARIIVDPEIQGEQELCEQLLVSSIPFAQQTGARFVAMESRQRSPIVATMHRHMQVFRVSEVDRATSASDIDIASLRAQPTQLYLTMHERDQQSLSPLYAMILGRLLDDCTRALPHDNELDILAMLDEFHLVASAALATKLATLRKYRVRIALLTQTYAQIQQRCGGAHETISGVCNVRAYYRSLDSATQRLAGDSLGTETRYQTTHTRQRNGASTVATTEQQRPLLLPAELGELGNDEIIVHLAGEPPIRAGRTRVAELP